MAFVKPHRCCVLFKTVMILLPVSCPVRGNASTLSLDSDCVQPGAEVPQGGWGLFAGCLPASTQNGV